MPALVFIPNYSADSMFHTTSTDFIKMGYGIQTLSSPPLKSFFCLAEADLRIGELQWGDSGIYFCSVVISDDVEGKNEGQLELLVLGRPVFQPQ